MAEARYSIGKKPEVIKLEVNGSVPSTQEMEQLTKIKFEKRRPDSAEAKRVIKRFLICIPLWVVAIILLVLLGKWYNDLFDGVTGAVDGAIRGGAFGGIRVLASAFACFVLILSCIRFNAVYRYCRPVRNKSAFDAMKWVWIDSLLNNDTGNLFKEDRFGKPEFAVSALERIVPTAISFPEEQLKEYLQQTREVIAEAADVTTAPLKNAHSDWKNAKPIKTLTKEEERDIAPGVKQIRASLSFQDRILRNISDRKSQYLVTAELEIVICQTYICADGRWFPYEIMSPIQWKESNPEALRQKAAEADNTVER